MVEAGGVLFGATAGEAFSTSTLLGSEDRRCLGALRDELCDDADVELAPMANGGLNLSKRWSMTHHKVSACFLTLYLSSLSPKT